MREWADGLWTIDAPFRLTGMELGTRTTAVRLRGGGLLLHSPGPLDAAKRAALEKRGRVRALVAPNSLHHLFLRENAGAFPEAEIWAAPGVRAKRKDLEGLNELGDEAPALWAGDLEQVEDFPVQLERAANGMDPRPGSRPASPLRRRAVVLHGLELDAGGAPRGRWSSGGR